ncbi:DUF11 domain-containing protein [Candidatus Parcubacteria bacterium]|nr:DUF11 domain-containing protein [Candidatus Parcubacteria bacterium]
MQEDKGRIDDLNESLNSRTSYRAPGEYRVPISPSEAPAVQDNWQGSPNIDEMLTSDRRVNRNHPLMRRVFILALAFFICALFAAAYIFLGGKNFISTKNVEVSIRGPVSVNAGDILSFEVSVLNKNNADLDTSSLTIQYPDGTRNPDNPSKNQGFTKEDLGELGSGKEVTKTENAILFGTKGEVKEIKASVDYKIKGSNATFSVDKTFEVTIGAVPVTMTVTGDTNVTSGDTYTTTVTLISNSPQLLKNVVVKGEYPYGFTLLDSSPSSPSGSDNVWVIGDMVPGARRVITLHGKLLGEDSEERTFRFYAGVSAAQDPEKLDTALASVFQTIALSRPEVQIKLALNGESSQTYIAPPGRLVEGTLTLTNNSPTAVIKNHIEAKLVGNFLDRSSVKTSGSGFYNSQTNTIVWDAQDTHDLTKIAPGDSALFSFSFLSLLNNTPNAGTPEINLSVSASGVTQGSQTGNYTTNTTRKVKLASVVSLGARTLHSKGPFENTGPLPPRAEQETTYAAVFDLGNTQSDIKDAKLTATLGPGVVWVMPYSKSSESTSYDATTRRFTWDVGTLPSGTGFGTPVREVAIQVRLTPSLSQVSSVPVLVTDIRFTGTDTFTNQEITMTAPSLTTSMPSDPAFIQGDEVVVK